MHQCPFANLSPKIATLKDFYPRQKVFWSFAQIESIYIYMYIYTYNNTYFNTVLHFVQSYFVHPNFGNPSRYCDETRLVFWYLTLLETFLNCQTLLHLVHKKGSANLTLVDFSSVLLYFFNFLCELSAGGTLTILTSTDICLSFLLKWIIPYTFFFKLLFSCK